MNPYICEKCQHKCNKEFNSEGDFFLYLSRKKYNCVLEMHYTKESFRQEYYENTRGILFKDLIKDYENNKETLRSISRKYFIDIKWIKCIFKTNNAKIKSLSESIKLQNQKNFLAFKEKYGVNNPFQLESVKEKSKQKHLEHFGVENVSQSEEIKKKKEETTFKHYGVKNPFESEEIKERMKETSLKHFGTEYPSQSKTVQNKAKETIFLKYGVDHFSKTEEYKEKYKKTSLQRYGVDNPSKTQSIKNKIRKQLESIGKWPTLKSMPKFKRYVLDVLNETKKHIKELYENWDGTCFYTKEKLINNEEYKKTTGKNPNTNKLQPTIDHKISKIYGFINNIPPEKIGSLDNLCICARYINSKKSKLNYNEFMNFIVQNNIS